ncbi:MAG: hypothetical protein SangKO_068230 [Sandaracinaceae bacterium]
MALSSSGALGVSVAVSPSTLTAAFTSAPSRLSVKLSAVTVLGSHGALNVTRIEASTATSAAPSSGDVETTVNAPPSPPSTASDGPPSHPASRRTEARTAQLEVRNEERVEGRGMVQLGQVWG